MLHYSPFSFFIFKSEATIRIYTKLLNDKSKYLELLNVVL